MKTNYEKKLFLARVILALALLVGVMSAFQDWLLWYFLGGLYIASLPDICRIVESIVYELFENYFPLGRGVHYWQKIIGLMKYSGIVSLFIVFLLPIFAARIFTRSYILWGLWLFLSVSWVGLIGYMYYQHVNSVTLQIFSGRGTLDIAWLSGFYFGCSAVVLHLLGMLLLYFSCPHKADSVIEANAMR